MKTNKYPVVMLVSYQNDSTRYQTTYEATSQEFEKLSQKNVPTALLELRNKKEEIERDAKVAAAKLEPFNFADFEKDFLLNNPHFKQGTLLRKLQKELPAAKGFDFKPYEKKFSILTDPIEGIDTFAFTYLNFIKKKIVRGKIGTAVSNHCAYRSLLKYGGNRKLLDITPDYLYAFEDWLLKEEECSITTVGIYTTSIRTIWNVAIRGGIVRKEKYPFGKEKYTIPKSRNIKKALEPEEVTLLYNYTAELVAENRARDLWFFMYNGNGMQPKDLAKLKYKNIDGDYLTFYRAKTEETSRLSPMEIRAYVNEHMKRTIALWGNKDRNPGNYVFPIFSEGMSPLEEYKKLQLFIEYVNRWMGKIAEKVGLAVEKTRCGVGRHTFATFLHNLGITNAQLQPLLGHRYPHITDLYVKTLPTRGLKDIAMLLVQNNTEQEPVENTGSDEIFEHAKKII